MTLTTTTNAHLDGEGVAFEVHDRESCKYDALVLKEEGNNPTLTIFVSNRVTAERLFDAVAELAMNFRERDIRGDKK